MKKTTISTALVLFFCVFNVFCVFCEPAFAATGERRQAVALSVRNATYEKIMKEYLTNAGLPDAAVNIMQLFRVDLEGDGVDEVVIYAQNVVDPKKHANFWGQGDRPMLDITGEIKPSAEPGMYSVLLLRKIVGGKVREIPLVNFIVPKGAPQAGRPVPTVQRVSQFADLNGNGTLDIVFGSASHEGCSFSVAEVSKDGSFKVSPRNEADTGLYADIPDSGFPIPMLNGQPIPYENVFLPHEGWEVTTYVYPLKPSFFESYKKQLREAGFTDLGRAGRIESLWRYDRSSDGASLIVEMDHGESEFVINMLVNYLN